MSISDAELRAMRAEEARAFYPDTCTIQRGTPGSDDPYGSPVPGTLADHLTAQPCEFWFEQGVGEQQAPPRDVVRRAYRMRLPVGTDVTEADVVSAVANQLGESMVDGALNITQIVNDGIALLLLLERVE